MNLRPTKYQEKAAISNHDRPDRDQGNDTFVDPAVGVFIVLFAVLVAGIMGGVGFLLCYFVYAVLTGGL